jgi:hypothetical protein
MKTPQPNKNGIIHMPSFTIAPSAPDENSPWPLEIYQGFWEKNDLVQLRKMGLHERVLLGWAEIKDDSMTCWLSGAGGCHGSLDLADLYDSNRILHKWAAELDNDHHMDRQEQD